MTHLMGLVTQFRKVCNHPELFERRAIKSPIQFSSLEWMQDTVASQITSAGTRVSSSDPRSEAVPVVYNNHNPIAFQLPKLLYRDDIWDSSESGATTGSRSHVLHNLCNVWSPAHIAAAQNDVNDPFGFASLAHLSPGELTQIAALDDNLLLRWLLHAAWKHSHYDESSVDRKANAFSVLLQTDLAQHTAAPKPRSQRSPLEDLCQISEHWLTTPEDWSLTPREVRLFYPKLVAEPIGLECSDRSAYVKQHDITQVSAVSKLLLTGVSRVVRFFSCYFFRKYLKYIPQSQNEWRHGLCPCLRPHLKQSFLLLPWAPRSLPSQVIDDFIVLWLISFGQTLISSSWTLASSRNSIGCCPSSRPRATAC